MNGIEPYLGEEELEDPFLGDILGGLFGETEEEYEDPFLGDILGGLIGETEEEEESGDPFLGDILGGLLGEAGDMELLGEAAAEAETEEEADGFFGALIPLATSLLPKILPVAKKLLPKALGAAKKVAPQLIRGVSKIGSKLFKSPKTRPLVRTLPTIARNTVRSIAQQAVAGRPVTPVTAAKTLQAHARRVLKSPQRRRATAVRCRRMARRCADRGRMYVTIC